MASLFNTFAVAFACFAVVLAIMSPSEAIPTSNDLQRTVNRPVGYAGAICNANQILQGIAAGDQPQSEFNDYSAISNNYTLFGDARFYGDKSLNDTFYAIGVSDGNFQRWGGEVSEHRDESLLTPLLIQLLLSTLLLTAPHRYSSIFMSTSTTA